jgi:hypothetical protein
MSHVNLLPSEGFRALHEQSGFPRASKGARAFANEFAQQELEKLTKQMALEAAADKRAGLSKSHALSAIEKTGEVPPGYY